MTTRQGLLIGALENVLVSEPLGRGEKVGDSFLVTNDHEVIDRLLSPGFVRYAGRLEKDFLTRRGTFVAYDLHDFPSSPDADKVLTAWLLLVKRFVTALWLVKDNAASIEFGYLEFPHREAEVITRKFLQGLISNADAKIEPTEFSREELRCARQLFDNEILKLVDAGGRRRESRWNTALYFLEAARSVSNCGVKVAHYCTCLEALFATDSQELSHKLCERLAWYLETDSSERLQLYQRMKKAYGLRSRIVHGDKKAIERGVQAPELSAQCDDVLRRVLLRILGSSDHVKRRFMEGDDGDFEEYLLKLVLGEG